jgi:hypothetical protein
MKLKNILAVLCCAGLCLLTVACDDTEITISEPEVPAEIAEVTEAPTDEATDGSIASETGSTDDYIGYYVLTSETGDFPYDSLEIMKGYSDSMYFYTDNSVAASYIDYSEQRALSGNPLMIIELDINDVDGEFGVNPINQAGEIGLELVGQGNFEGLTATFMLDNETAETDTEDTDTSAIASDSWTDLYASFTRDGSDQYNNGVLELEYLGNDEVAFQIRVMEGSEDDDASTEVTYYGTMSIYEEDRAVYETTDFDGNPLTIYLILTKTEDEFYADVTGFGEFDISPDGYYVFTENLE